MSLLLDKVFEPEHGWRMQRETATASLFVGCLLLALSSLCSCRGRDDAQASPGNPGQKTVEVRYMATPGTVPPIELAEDLGYLAPLQLVYVSSSTSGPQSIQTVVTGDIDVGSAFNGAILKLVAAKAPIRAVVASYGVDQLQWSGFYVNADSKIRAPRDLIGKKVAVNTIGAHHEFVLKQYLAQHGLSQAEVRQVMLVPLPPVNSEQALRQGQTDVAVLGGIFRDRALERGGLRLLFSDQELFGSFTAGSYVMRDDFIAKHPEAAKQLVAGVGKAIEWARSTPRPQVIDRFKSIIAKRKRNEDTTVVGYWQSYGIAGRSGLLKRDEFQVWIDWMVRSGELRHGQLDVASVYTNAFNPQETQKQ
jgi:ABC-type nitrate/sulfonate/bicarbonate transport system substrate-binding protein